jgi:hypothetical protein
MRKCSNLWRTKAHGYIWNGLAFLDKESRHSDYATVWMEVKPWFDFQQQQKNSLLTETPRLALYPPTFLLNENWRTLHPAVKLRLQRDVHPVTTLRNNGANPRFLIFHGVDKGCLHFYALNKANVVLLIQ